MSLNMYYQGQTQDLSYSFKYDVGRVCYGPFHKHTMNLPRPWYPDICLDTFGCYCEGILKMRLTFTSVDFD